MGAERSAFCRWHRSHFCPCVRPDLYPDKEKAARAWDEAEQREREKQTPKEDR